MMECSGRDHACERIYEDNAMSNKEEKEAAAGEAVERKADAAAPKGGGAKLVLFNHSKNPYHLKNGPNGEKRLFEVGSQIECVDQAEYDFLKNYKGVATSQQVAPSLQNHIVKLETEKADLQSEVETLKKQLEKFQGKGK